MHKLDGRRRKMKKLRKIVASIVMLSVAFCMVPGMSAQADTCGGLEEVDV